MSSSSELEDHQPSTKERGCQVNSKPMLEEDQQQIKELNEELAEIKRDYAKELEVFWRRLYKSESSLGPNKPQIGTYKSQIDGLTTQPTTLSRSCESTECESSEASQIASPSPHQVWTPTDAGKKMPESLRDAAAVDQRVASNSTVVVHRRQRKNPAFKDCCCVNEIKIASEGGITAISRSMRRLGSDGGIAAVDAVLTTMERHKNSASIQTEACSALQTLCCSLNDQIQIVSEGGIDRVLDAMRRHKVSVEVQAQGCGALADLTINSEDRIEMATRASRTSAARRGHEGSINVQKSTRSAQRNLGSRNSAINEIIASEGGIDAILTAMRGHEASARVQEMGCNALWNLACGVSAVAAKIVSESGVETILNAMRRHRGSANVQKQGCGALWVIASQNSARKIKIASEGCIETVLTAMLQHKRAAGLQTYGCAVLQTLAIKPRYSVQIAASGGIGVVLTAMRRHKRAPILQALLCGICRALPTTNFVLHRWVALAQS